MSRQPLKGASILICEDEPFVAIDVALSVEEAGGRVIGPAASVSEAYRLLERYLVDGAIVDVNLSDGDITPVAHRLLQNGVPLIVQTGVGVPEELINSYSDLVALSKPVPPQRLIEMLSKLLP